MEVILNVRFVLVARWQAKPLVRQLVEQALVQLVRVMPESMV